ncbi:response regulator transcription factor [Rudaea sp.]|uniref:response regulator transcription factor n=1 Tax=Rudaea sp. TaxID=2136325 RepID=UPI002ED2560D
MIAGTDILRLATVEDDPRFRYGFATLLRSLPGFDLLASYSSAQPILDAAQAARQLGAPVPWDLVLTDIGLPGIDGIELTRRLKALFPQLRIVVLSVFEDPGNVLAAICAGADGYLLKGTTSEDMVAKLDMLRRESSPLSIAVASTVLNLVRESQKRSFAGIDLPPDLGLSDRQLEILRGLVDGLSYRDIGTRHGITTDGVRSHVRRIYAKLQVHNVAEAVGYALRHGMV